MIERLRRSLRQGRHHPEFRIGPRSASPPAPPALWVPDPQPAPTSGAAGVDGDGLIGVANQLWRAHKRLRQAQDAAAGDLGRAPKRTRQAEQFMNAALTELKGLGLEVQDHDDTRFHPGHSLDVVLVEDDPALSHPTVTETLLPSIYFRDRRVQIGRVIVGRPPAADSTQENADA